MAALCGSYADGGFKVRKRTGMVAQQVFKPALRELRQGNQNPRLVWSAM